MRDVEQAAIRAADTAQPVLIMGEAGTGREVVARTIHFLSARWAEPVVKLNVTSLPPNLVGAELFGKDTSSVILHEVGEIPLKTQARLVRLLEDPARAAVRIFATTSRDLSALAAASAFRRDLLERLDALRILVPPLRERREEIPHLVDHFRHLFAGDFRRPTPTVSPQLSALMVGYDWPGNVRELEHLVKRWVVLGDEGQILEELKRRSESLRAAPVAGTGEANEGLRDIARRAAREAERLALQATLERTRGNRAAAARALKISYKTLLQKMAETGLSKRRRAAP